jgi:hypothetical protein
VQFLARFKADGFTGRNADFSPGAGIAANPGFAGTDAENAESTQFNALTRGQGLLQALKDRIHRGLCLGARQAGALDNLMDNVLFNQWGILAGATGIECTTTYSADATDFAANMELKNELSCFSPEEKQSTLPRIPALPAGGRFPLSISSTLS